MKNENKKDKISVGRIIKNGLYVLGYLMKVDKAVCIVYFSVYCLISIIDALTGTYLFKVIVDCLTDNTKSLWETIGVICLSASLSIISSILNVVIYQWRPTRMIRALGTIRQSLIEKCAKIDLMCYDKPEYFEDFVLAAQNSEQMLDKSLGSFTSIIGNVLTIFTIFGLILTVDPIIALFPIAGFIINIITRFAISKNEYNYSMEQQRVRRKADYSKRVFYQPEYAKELKLSDIGVPLKKQLLEALDEENAVAKKFGMRTVWLSLINWITVFTLLSFFAVPMYLGYLALIKGSILLGDVASMNNAANRIRGRLDNTNYALIEFQEVGQFTEKFRRFIEYDVNIEATKGRKALPDGISALEIRDMSFRYDENGNDILHNINITIKPGEKIAIVGENGAGKTTFVKLLMRLYDVTGGGIYYGGENIKDFDIAEYRSKIGGVFQDFQIYAASLGENVKMDFFSPDDRESAEKALDLADFSTKLQKLKEQNQGLDTELTREFSDVGTMLSGGESQKVAISRLFARGHKLEVAILDEPSSALDPVAEYVLNQNMMKNAEHASVIFISHRLSTTRCADRIYMFEHGRIIEQGTHDELMALGGAYATMFEKQAHYYKLKLDDETA